MATVPSGRTRRRAVHGPPSRQRILNFLEVTEGGEVRPARLFPRRDFRGGSSGSTRSCSRAGSPHTWRCTVKARLLGLALLRDLPPDRALLIPGCRSVHTFGMRFALDVVFLDAAGRPLRVVRGLRPCRVASCRRAVAVFERRAARDGMIPAMSDQAFANRFRQALDPRVPIYRDAYNEYFMLVLSAGGAAAGTQVPLYIVMAITGLWGVIPFAAACVVFELAVIFGLARPR